MNYALETLERERKILEQRVELRAGLVRKASEAVVAQQDVLAEAQRDLEQVLIAIVTMRLEGIDEGG